jgi:hypothetical protein
MRPVSLRRVHTGGDRGGPGGPRQWLWRTRTIRMAPYAIPYTYGTAEKNSAPVMYRMVSGPLVSVTGVHSEPFGAHADRRCLLFLRCTGLHW